MVQRKKGFTTMVEIEEFKRLTWSFLANITMQWQYDGMAYLFREADIPLYGVDRGTTKMNHPLIGIMIPSSRDKNYGVDIYVPSKLLKKARRLIANEEALREAAQLEELHGARFHEEFTQAALASKERDALRRKSERKEKRDRILGKFSRNRA